MIWIHRTRIDQDIWRKLKDVSEILTNMNKKKVVTTREMLINQACSGLLKYFEKKMGI